MFIQGYGVLQNGQRAPLKDEQIKHDDIKFVVLRDWWARLNPAKDKYDFSHLEKQAERVRDAGKRFILGPMTGDAGPRWIPTPRASWRNGGNDYRDVALPWGSPMLDEYEKLINKLSSEFAAATPIWITGPTVASQEMHTNGVDKVVGYSSKKMELAWIRAINIVQSRFNNCILSISGQSPVLKYLESVIQEAKDLGKASISFQHNSLGHQTTPAAAHEHRMRSLFFEGYNSGREMIQPGNTAAIKYHAKFIHYCVLYPQDVGKPLPALATAN